LDLLCDLCVSSERSERAVRFKPGQGIHRRGAGYAEKVKFLNKKRLLFSCFLRGLCELERVERTGERNLNVESLSLERMYFLFELQYESKLRIRFGRFFHKI
jgi:hypothetical protein